MLIQVDENERHLAGWIAERAEESGERERKGEVGREEERERKGGGA